MQKQINLFLFIIINHDFLLLLCIPSYTNETAGESMLFSLYIKSFKKK